MMPPDDDTRRERAYELLALRTVEPLSALEAAELEHLLVQLPDIDPEELDRIAADLLVSELGATGHPPLPDRLRSRVETDADFFFALTGDGDRPATSDRAPRIGGFASDPSDGADGFGASLGDGGDESDEDVGLARQTPAGPRLSWTTVTPWVVAAAAAAVAVIVANRPPEIVTKVEEVEVPVEVPPPPPPPEPPPEVARARFLEAHPDRVVAAFNPGPDDAGEQVRGDVVWSDEAQTGFMRLEGLAPNDPTEAQYQLWIFDAARDERHPVDGGVFDVKAGDEVVVPIDAKLPVDRPTLFAVTVEPPGGVVVSTRERLAAVAEPEPS